MTVFPIGTETKDVQSLHIVVLAAGKGTRMRSGTPKVLHRLSGLPLIDHVLRAAGTLAPATTTVVVGHEADQVRTHLRAWPHVQTVRQEPQLGTGHALLMAEPVLAGHTGTVVLLSGDVPLLSPASLGALVARHRDSGAVATVVTAMVERPFGYGRILRTGGDIARIIEERDAGPAEREIKEINAGIYAFELEPLFDALRSIGAENAQHEYYLPDLVSIYRRQRMTVATWTISNTAEIRGINSRSELAEVGRIMRQQKHEELMAAGVTLVDPATTYIDVDVEVGADSVIHPGVHLEGSTRVGASCEIHAGSRLVNATLADGVVILNHCVITSTSIAEQCQVGPFAHLRPESVLGPGARVGNFVELKKTNLGAGAKANHLAYLGDAVIGQESNIGAGTITCNYDGTRKHQTTVGRAAFVGSNSTLVAPLTIGDGAYVAAGSAITQDVPADALGMARTRQENKPDWAAKRRAAQPSHKKPRSHP
jgi:bifunctional UDP-N-acetylglucosamine pyrophosphorylase/glucosamine-1-phosphate N-acetyltransferase